ncbi:carboxyl transferase domain-containing protein, partial [Streptomyces flavofungini]|uniref:carboxyl transferase domain-containing protein n=1 Tax=Streptomyces flavofungini TaxID=68200 RepID=UPI0034DFE241
MSARAVLTAVASAWTELPAPRREDGTGADEGEGEGEAADGPLDWRGYGAARRSAAERTGARESVVCAAADIGGVPVVALAFEFGFLGGSIGRRTGDLIEAAHRHARTHRLPVVTFVATGGSRMQEGLRALSQLQRVARQSALTRAAGLPQLAVLRDPTTGGGWATLGAGADMTLALPGSQVAFAGSRVRPPDADPAAYTAEAQFAAGHLDAVVAEGELPGALALRLRLLTSPRATGPVPPPDALGRTAPGRPRADAYLDAYFSSRVEVSGDRCGGRDPGVSCGFGLRDGHVVAFAAQRGTATRPAGYRTAARLIRLADRLGIPVLTLVDTPGAAHDAAAEQAGAGPAIADLFAAVASAGTPLTTLVIGEGGSG